MKTIKGTVKSLKNSKTAAVLVVRRWQHPLYKKMVTKKKLYACHNELNDLKEGDMVTIKESKPYSKTKRYIVVEKLK